MSTSQNGWPVFTESTNLADLTWVTGRVRPGDVHTVFDYFCTRFNREVQTITVAWSWGWAYRPIRGQTDGLSNHASATGIDLNAPLHPLGVRGTFTPAQVHAIHAILDDLDGVVRWGGDYVGRPDEMHFEINDDAARVGAVAAALYQEDDDMPLSPEDLDKIAGAVWANQITPIGGGDKLRAARMLAQTHNRADIDKRLRRIVAELDTLADGTVEAATKGQARRIRKDLADLADSLGTDPDA